MKAVAQGRFCANIEKFTLEWLISEFLNLVNETDSIKSLCAAIVKSYTAELSQQFDELFLPGHFGPLRDRRALANEKRPIPLLR
jgi:hypothetical protein